MKKNITPKYTKPPILFLTLHLLIALFFIQSCTTKDKYSKQEKTNTEKVETAVDFDLLVHLNETNIKIIETTNLILEQPEIKFPKPLLLKILKDHSAIQNELKKLAEENLIITQKPIYSLELNEDVIKNDTNGKFTLHILEKSIKKEIATFQKMEKNFSHEDFILFANQSIALLIENQNTLSQVETN